ncbi:MAG: TIGR04372 family glycosyltransferase [Rhodospirillales bacterium]
MDTRVLEDLVRRAEAAPGDAGLQAQAGMRLAAVRVLQQKAEPFLLRALALSAGNEPWVLNVVYGLLTLYAARGDHASALTYAELGCKLAPTVTNLRMARAMVLFRLGLVDRAQDAWRDIFEAQYGIARDYARAKGWPVAHALAPETEICRFFGEMAAKPDLYLKAKALGLIEPAEAHLLAPPDLVCNKALMAYWADHLILHETAEARDAALPDLTRRRIYLDVVRLPDGRYLHRDLAHRAVQAAWEAAGRGPLLTLKPAHRGEGRARLARRGFADDDWFVAWHVRDAATFLEDISWSPNRYRNAELATYIAGVQAILDRGGWVVRLGDPQMPRLADIGFTHPRLIDYAHGGTDLRADWMDLFLVAEARFYFGMASGPSSVAVNFGTPTLGTNWFHLGPWPYCSGDLFLPKRLVRRADAKPLTLSETLAPGLWGALEPPLFDALGIEVIDNSEVEIAEAVTEMLDRLEGPADEAEEDRRRQAAFAQVADPFNLGMPARCGAAFLRRHPELCE